MKTRDELAEAILLASVATDPTTERTRMMSPEAAYRQADAFVAERERRAVVVPTDSAPVVKCKHCEQPALHRDRADRTGWLSPPCCGGGACCIASEPGHSRAPLADAPAPEAKKPHDPDDGCAGCEHYVRETAGWSARCVAMGKSFGVAHDASRPAAPHCPKRAPAETAALKFSDSGLLLDANGDVADEDNDGYSAMAYGYAAAVTIRATDRAQSERKVAAMLKVGRETK